MSLDNYNNAFNLFLSQGHGNEKHTYLVPKKMENSSAPLSYDVVGKNPEFISEYAHHRFKEIGQIFKNSKNSGDIKLENLTQLKATAAAIYADYKVEYKKVGFLERIFHNALALFGIHHSHKEIETEYQTIQSQLAGDKAIQLGGKLQALGDQAIEARREAHRNPTVSDYSKVALSKGPYTAAFKEKETANKEGLQSLPKEEKAIAVAKLKEEACQETYDTHLQGCIDSGFYDPEIIPFDIDHLLGKAVDPEKPIVSSAQLHSLLKNEVDRYQKDGKLSKAQAHRLKHDAIDVAKLYKEAFPGKSHRDGFILVRDLIRIATYQEYYDKGSFNGSDHGSKHIHNNILGSLALHKGMEMGKDYTIKDQLIEELTHFFHDVGYSVGLAAKDFDCCKDHPFIGAKMLESNKDYFIHYLDETSYNALHKCVLYHAIIYPDLTARAEENGVHLNMIRAVTSISDACAVTYDRKTQEFWEQPRSLVALARIKSFLILFPQYKFKLGDDIVKGPWAGYDPNNPIDKMAYDVFLHTRNELFEMVNEYDIPAEKKDLFRQAISQQFNAFKANITLGQYGAVLAGLESVPNENKTSEQQPDYTPQVNLGLSIAYGVLKDLFGEDQANDSFKKMVEEFSGDMANMNHHLQDISNGLNKGEPQKDRIVTTGVAKFKLLGNTVTTPGEKPEGQLEANLKVALGQIHSVFKEQQGFLPTRNQALKNLDLWTKDYKKDKQPPFAEFVTTSLLPIIPFDKIEEITRIQKFVEKSELNDADLEKIKGLVAVVFMSENEYKFMRGQEAISRESVLASGLENKGEEI